MGDHQRKRSLDCCTSSLRSSPSNALKMVSDMSSGSKEGTVKKPSQGNKRRRIGAANPSNDKKSTCEELNQSSSTSYQSSDKHSPCSFTYPNINHNLSKHHSSNGQTGYTLLNQSSHCESSGFSCNSYTKPQQLLSTNCSDNLSSSKTSFVHPSDEKNKACFNAASLDLVATEKPFPKNSKQCNDTDIQSTTQPVVSENSEIQASILALESLLQVKSNLKNKDVTANKPQISEKIANRNSKWEDDEKLGARATVGPVLYSNICLNLKETHPEWTSRAAAIAYIWHRQLSNETRKIYSEMAKRNKQLLNNQPKSKQANKTGKGNQVTGTLACSAKADKNLCIQKSQSTSNMTQQPFHPSKTSTSQSKSLSSTAEICLEGNSIKIMSSGQQLAIKRPAIKSDSSLSTKKSTITSNPAAKEAHMDAKRFMEQPTDKQIEFFRIRARYLRYRRATASLILNDDLYNDMPFNKDCVLTGEYGNAKLKGNWDTYANYPLHNDKK